MRFLMYCFFLFFFTSLCHAQKPEYALALIPDSLKIGANAVVRLQQFDIDIHSQREMEIKQIRVVTVLNESGQNAIDAQEWYSKKRNVTSIEARVYDAAGNELKRIRRKDFRDQSYFDGFSIASDARTISLDYTPVQYPFTIVYESEISTSNTAFIPQWQPVQRSFVSVEKSVLNVSYPPDLGFSSKEYYFSGFKIEKTDVAPGKLTYTAVQLPAKKEEHYSPETYEFLPRVMMAVEYFNLEGVDGNAKNWKEFGKWYADKILAGTTELPEETKVKIITLVGNETNPIAKARIVYNYVQQKSRYVSIQIGIGGFKPMMAKDVDRLGYGDCKALSNYTRALLDVVGVPSYYTILYGDMYRKRNIESGVISEQGNHIILAVPDGDQYVFLECTSQDIPFGYQANFTDDRDVLLIKPEGGEIVRTKNYPAENNLQISKGSYKLDDQGNFSGTLLIQSEGSQYNPKYTLKDSSPTEKEDHYKKLWSNISNLKIESATFDNDRVNASFKEHVDLTALNYGAITGNKMMVVMNAYNMMAANVKRIRNRQTPFQILRGFFDKDEIAIELPVNFAIETLPNNYVLDSKFGSYKTELVRVDDRHVVYKRQLLLNKGNYRNSEYEDYRLFVEQIARNDNAKIILAKTL
jgi:transglutaminase-like putative cysteine protease